MPLGIGSRAIWAAKITGLALWATLGIVLAVVTFIAVATLPFWIHMGSKHDIDGVLESCMSIGCLQNKSLCGDLVRYTPRKCGPLLVNETLNCTSEAYPLIEECDRYIENIREADSGPIFIGVMMQAMAVASLIGLCFSAISTCAYAKLQEEWANGPDARPPPAPEGPDEQAQPPPADGEPGPPMVA